LATSVFEGTWKSKVKQNILENQEGIIQMNLFYAFSNKDNEIKIEKKEEFFTKRKWRMLIALKDPRYNDEHLVEILNGL